MEIRKATPSDLEEILKIYAHARKFMAENGNPSQWGQNYPAKERVEQDIAEKKCHLCVEQDAQGQEKILAVFYFAKEEDPTYGIITEGQWLDDKPYGVVHRIASAEGTRGAASFCLNWACEQAGSIRIDTGYENKPMQGLLKKLGFRHCGNIFIADGSPRMAFQKRVN